MTSTKYRCVNCDHEFEVAEEDTSSGPRCPKCHRVHDVVRRGVPSGVPWYRTNGAIAAAVLLGVVGAGVVVYVVRMRPPQKQEGTAPTIPAASRDELTALLAKAPPGPDADLLAGKSSAPLADRARALGRILRALHDGGSWKVQDIEAPAELLERELVEPTALLQKLGPGGPAVTSLEAALLALRMARAAGLGADVVRVERYGDAKVPADPSGLLGHYAVEVQGTTPIVLIDPSLEGGAFVGAAETVRLSDAACGGILEAGRALREFLPRPERPQPNPLAAQNHLDKARQLAPDEVPVRLVAAYVAIAEDPGRAFAQIDELMRTATTSQKMAVAELYLGLTRLKDAESIVADADRVYPGWARIPLVRGQIALVRASALLMKDTIEKHPGRVPPERAEQMRMQIQALGITASDRVDDQFTLMRQALAEAERRGGSRSTDKLRELYAVAFSQYRLEAGDVAGAQQALELANQADPSSPSVALPLAAVLIAQSDSLRARQVLEPAAAKAGASVDDLMGAADQMAARIRAAMPRPEAPAGSPFDLAAPAAPVPTTEPSLQMPGMGLGRPDGLGQGLQLRW